MKFLFQSDHKNISHKQAYIILVCTIFLWAIGVVIARGVRDEIPLIGLSFWRWFSALFILLPFVFTNVVNNLVLIRNHLRIYILLGGLMLGSGTLLFYALNYTTAINATLVNATQPVTTVFFAWTILGHRLNKFQVLGFISALSGVVVMVCQLDWQTLINLDFNTGDILVILAITGYGLYAVNIRKLPHELGSFTNLFMIITFGIFFILPFYIAESIYVKPITFDLKFLAVIFVLSILVSILSMKMWNTANAVVGPGKAAIFVNLMPVFGSILALALLSESLYFYHVIGFMMVCSGIFMVVKKDA